MLKHKPYLTRPNSLDSFMPTSAPVKAKSREWLLMEMLMPISMRL